MIRTMWSKSCVVLLWLASSVFDVDCRSVLGEESPRATQSTAWQPVPENGVIAEPGRYSLQQEIQVDRSTGIKIEADDVTLDLCRHAIRYTGISKEGTFGIVAPNRTGVTITNGTVGGFWFNMHCTQTERLRIHNIRFDDIPYIGINVAQSKDVMICDNVFENFRYELAKAQDSTYVIGINIGAQNVVITNNRFMANPRGRTTKDVDVETVFVLFSAEVSKDCIVAKNDIAASEVLPRSYGVWVATNAQATIIDNVVRNVKYGVCLADDASALVCFNRFRASANKKAPIETIGISASGAKDVIEIRNAFDGITTPATLPKN